MASDPGAGEPAVSPAAVGQPAGARPSSEELDVEQLKQRIAQTRDELGQTVEALAAKADVKARASGAVHEAIDTAKARVHDLATEARDRVGVLTGSDRHSDQPALVAASPAVGAAGLDDPLASPQRRIVLDRRLQTVLLATAVGAVLGAVLIWVKGRRS